MNSSESVSAYFCSIFQSGRHLAASLPLRTQMPSMDVVTSVLRPAVDARLTTHDFMAPEAAVLTSVRMGLGKQDRSQGLNTIGMLMDRLSILTMKHWALVNRSDSADRAKELEETQIADLLRALAEAQPGSSSINNKLTNHDLISAPADFVAATYGLFTTNILLWESQEVLYNRNILALPCEELRSYISFFSEGNLRRNVYIQACDDAWWTLVRSAP